MKVELSHDADEWFEVNGTHTWEYSWDTTGLKNGYYDIWARALDGEEYSEVMVLTVLYQPMEILVKMVKIHLDYPLTVRITLI